MKQPLQVFQIFLQIVIFLTIIWAVDRNYEGKELRKENNELKEKVHYLEEFQRNLIMNHPELDPIGARVKTN